MGDWERFLVLEELTDRSHQGKTYVNVGFTVVILL